MLAAGGEGDVVIGGAFVGDQALPVARVLQPPRRVHAFEPMAESARRLRRNIELSGVGNVVVQRAALWDRPGTVWLHGALALASTVADPDPDHGDEAAPSLRLDDYASESGVGRIGLIALDLEGGELAALRGAATALDDEPNVVFEIHRTHVDWSDGLPATDTVRLLTDRGYHVFAIRDQQANAPMRGRPIELVPVDDIHLDGPPHGFNLLASCDPTLVERLAAIVVPGVSPKLLPGRGPLHAPTT